MDCVSLGCQVCLSKSNRVCEFKDHMRSQAHEQKMKEVFQKSIIKGAGKGFFPFIIMMDRQARLDIKIPIIVLESSGLQDSVIWLKALEKACSSLLTLCFSPDTNIFFYLCHVCEEKCDKIACHLSSGDHCSNYVNYTDPNALRFSWVPSMNMRDILRHGLANEKQKRGPGQLQMLDLPENLLKELETSTYSQVMQTLSENDKLLNLFKAVQPKRTMIQTYQRDRNRKHPLLGMQHVVECICVGPTEKRYYLCTLCNLTLASHMIIRHVLSFDHIFCYFRVWHPSTLMSKECYKDYSREIVSMIRDFARQTEEIHDSANTDMKQVSLEPAQFASVNFTCYADALKKLESITKESLITSVKPGNKLEVSAALLYKLRCQICNTTFATAFQYFKHVPERNHIKMLKKFFGEAARADDRTEWKSSLGVYGYLKDSWKQKQPAIGVPLVVTCVCSEAHVEPIYVCFACEDSFSESSLREHFNSHKHVINTLLYQNPWRLPFAWESLDKEALRSMAWEEEKDREPDQMMLKVLDIPYGIFWNLIPASFEKVMRSLQRYHTLLKREVPRRETFSKLQQNERFPQLGRQFLVMSVVRQQPTEVGFLCLLCEERLSDDDCYAHVFSRKHVETFLKCFHPGSLNSSTDAETLLDLAKQAARNHPVSPVQVIHLDKPIWKSCSYLKAIFILESAKRRGNKGKLKPPIKPGMKLVPRGALKDMDKDHLGDNSQKNSGMMAESEEKSSQMSMDKSETTLKMIKEEVGAEITNTHGVERENAEKEADKETPTPSEKELERKREVFSETSSEEIKNVLSETCQAVKEEKMEEPTARKPSGEALESCQNTDTDNGTDIGKEKSKSSKDVPTEFQNNAYKENERKMSEKSQDTCPNMDVKKEMGHETSKQDTSCEKPQNEGESGKPSHETAKDKDSSNEKNQQAAQLWQYVKMKSREPVVGLSALLECHCDQHDPIYLCECCSQKIPEKDIVSHVTGFYHQKIYLVVLQKLPTPPGKDRRQRIRLLAASFEQDKGYGEAQVVEVDEEIYDNILKQDFKSAIQTVKAFQAQQDSCELPSTSALSALQPLDTSVSLHAQHEFCSVTHDFQVVEMEIDDDSEDSEAQPSSTAAAVSVMTQTTSEVPPESTEDVRMTQIKESKSADKGNTCLTVSRASEDTSGLHGSTSGTNTARLHPDSTGNNSKAEIIPNTTMGPLKIATTSKILGSSQTAATSDSTVTTPTKSMTAVSKCTAKSSISTQDTTKSTALISSMTGTTSISRETISNTTSTTKSARVSKPLESRAGAGVTAASYKAATASNTGSTVVPEAICRAAPASKIENRTKNSEIASKTTAASKAMVPSGATAKMTKTSIKCENTEASAKTVHMNNSVGSNADVAPNIPKSNSPAAPPPPTEPSPTSASKRKPYESLLKVGLSQLISVTCKGKRQVYCQLCSMRLKRSTHTMSSSHQINYVQMKYPGWTPKRSNFESQLDKALARLAEVERDAQSRCSQIFEVKSDVYKELAALPEDIAVERLKTMITQRDSQASSSPTTDTAEVLRQQVAFTGPFEASSPDDGMNMLQEEMAGLDNQSEQEKKHDVQTPEIEERNLAAGQSNRAQSLSTSEPEANDPISDQLHSCVTSIKNDPEPIAARSIQDADIAVHFKQEAFESDVVSQAEVEVTPAVESPAVEMEKPLGSAGMFAQTPDSCQETPGVRQQQERRDPELQDTQKVLEDAQKTSPVKFFYPDPLPSAASVNTEQRNQPKPSQKAEHVPNHPGCSPGPGHHSALKALQRISIGERTQVSSHLSTILKVKGQHTEPIIGLGFVWECRGVSPTFFLCESCQEMLFIHDICQHMVSDEHKLKYILMQYPQFLSFWSVEDLPQQMKLELLKEIAWLLLQRERFNKIDAQVVLLRPELYECVRTAPFSEALKMVQNIKKSEKLSVHCLPISTRQQKDQQPEDRQSPERSLLTERQSAEDLGTDQRSDNEARPKTEKHHLEETAMVRQQIRVSSPLDVTSVPSKADSVVSPFPGVGPCVSPLETSSSLSMQPELGPLASQQQRPIPELQVKHGAVHSESQSSSIVSPKTSQTLAVFPRDKCPPTRKRPAATSTDTLFRPCTNALEEPLPAKYRRSSLQPISQPSPESPSESTPVNPTATSPVLSPEDTGLMEQLIALLRKTKAEMRSPPMSAPDSAGDSSLINNSPSEGGVERRWDPKCQLLQSTVGHENQLVTPNASSAFSANNSSLEGLLKGGDLMFTMTEAKAVGTMLPSASTADPSDPQHQRSVNAHSMFGNVSQVRRSPFHYVATSHTPGQIAQPRGITEVDSTEVCQLPINAIVTARPDPPNKQFRGGCNKQDHTEVNRGNRVTQSFSTVATANPSDTLAASGGYGQYSQMAYFTNGCSGLSSEAITGYITPKNPPVYPGGVYQQGQTTRSFYISQIDPEQEANHFGHSSAILTPQGWVRLTQQQQQQQQLTRQQQQRMQQLTRQQQQYSSWTSAAPAAGDGKGTNEAAYLRAAPSASPANNSQRFIDLNDYSTNIIVPTQNRNNVITQNTPRVYLNPRGIYRPPTANSGVISQESAFSFCAAGTEYFTVAPSVTNATPPSFP